MQQVASKNASDELANSDSYTRLMLFPTFAYRKPEQSKWRADVTGVAYSEAQKRITRRILLKVLRRMMDVPRSEMHGELFESRVRPFFCAPRKGKKIHLEFGSVQCSARKRSRRGGHFRSTLKMHSREVDSLVGENPHGEFELQAWANLNDQSQGRGAAPVQVIEPEGLTVISDIDDTIKESNVENRRELLINTFLKEYRQVPGMSGVYQQLQRDANAVFHYVSASPWQLFDSLSEFASNGAFPRGSMHLRKVRLSDQVLKRLPVLKRGGKTKVIKKIIKRFPQRQFVLIGDSVEMDPQIYLKLLQSSPNQIKAILIRLVSPNHANRDSVRQLLQLRAPGFELFEDSEELAAKLKKIDLIADE